MTTETGALKERIYQLELERNRLLALNQTILGTLIILKEGIEETISAFARGLTVKP